jgi:hypothetical protein
MTRLCFLDTETTSLAPDRQAWEVGMILRIDNPGEDRIEQEIQFYVDVDLDHANLDSLGIGRFWDRHPMGRYLSGREQEFAWSGPGMPRPGDSPGFLNRGHAAITVAQWTIGAHIIGIVPDFDMTGTLAPLLRAHGLVPAWHYHLHDAEERAAGYLGWEPPYSTEEILAAMGVERPADAAHTALGDAYTGQLLWDAVPVKPRDT